MEANDPTAELLYFLSKYSPSKEVKIGALEYLVGLTGSEDGKDFILRNIGDKLSELLEDILKDDRDDDVSALAFKSIINLSADNKTSDLLLTDGLLNCLFKIIITCTTGESNVNAESACMSLSNLAHWESGALKIMKFLQKDDNTMVFYELISKFCAVVDGLHYLGSFFSNLSQVQEARVLFLDKEKLILQRLLSFISFKDSKIRQHGIIAMVKNCCFEVDSHLWLLSESVDILPKLLLPLAGPETFDEEDNEKLPLDLQYLEDTKERESDPIIRKTLIEAISKLCTTQEGRKKVKDANSYVILRELHKWETDDACIAATENLISLLISDEPERGMEDLHKVVIPEDLSKKLNNAE